MTEQQLSVIHKAVDSDEYRMAIAGAQICAQKIVAAESTDDYETIASAAALEAIEYYDIALRIVKDALEKVEHGTTKFHDK